jgi:hypothetical protein
MSVSPCSGLTSIFPPAKKHEGLFRHSSRALLRGQGADGTAVNNSDAFWNLTRDERKQPNACTIDRGLADRFAAIAGGGMG